MFFYPFQYIVTQYVTKKIRVAICKLPEFAGIHPCQKQFSVWRWELIKLAHPSTEMAFFCGWADYISLVGGLMKSSFGLESAGQNLIFPGHGSILIRDSVI